MFSKKSLEKINVKTYRKGFCCGRMNWNLSLKKRNNLFKRKIYYYWFRYYDINKIVSMNPLERLESELIRRDENRQYIIDNKAFLCYHGHLHPMKSIKGKYISEHLYTHMRQILGKYWDRKKTLGLH